MAPAAAVPPRGARAPARRDALDDHRDTCYYELLDAIEQECADDPGRGEGSMTSCGRTGRRRRPRTTAEVNIIYRRHNR